MKNVVNSWPVYYTLGGVEAVLYFPSLELRQAFRAMHPCRCMGRRPVEVGKGQIERTRMNLSFYSQIRDFLPVWDSNVE